MRLAVVLLLSGSSLALQLPFKIPFFQTDHEVQVPESISSEPKPPRVAIIGAGAGGSSAAFWISKAKERYGLDIEIDVYDRESYVGGSE